jgi:hypothetical protein
MSKDDVRAETAFFNTFFRRIWKKTAARQSMTLAGQLFFLNNCVKMKPKNHATEISRSPILLHPGALKRCLRPPVCIDPDKDVFI